MKPKCIAVAAVIAVAAAAIEVTFRSNIFVDHYHVT